MPDLLPAQRFHFSIPDDTCYLNFAYMSAQLEAVRRAGESAVALKGQPWQIGAEHWFERVEEARATFAGLIGASADDVALVPSASYGMATAAKNVRLSAGDTALVLEDQFPSAVYPWRRLAQERDARLVTVARGALESWNERILEAIDASCRVVSVPAVHWSDGALLDLDAIGRRTREVGAQLVLDLSQSVGAMPFDVGRIDPDWICAPTYKWLLGPYAAGFLYVAPRHHDGKPLEENWIVRRGSEDFSRLVEYTDAYREGARRYDMGERSNFVLLPMVLAGLEQVHAWGVDRIAATLQQTNATLETIAARYGLDAIAAARRSPHILGLTRPGGLPADLVARLREQRVHVGLRGATLRVAPHLHVTDEDLQHFDYALGRCLA